VKSSIKEPTKSVKGAEKMVSLAKALKDAGVKRPNYLILNEKTKTELVVCPDCHDFLEKHVKIQVLDRTDKPCTRVTDNGNHGTSHYNNY
jgi:hypothetical protein